MKKLLLIILTILSITLISCDREVNGTTYETSYEEVTIIDIEGDTVILDIDGEFSTVYRKKK